MYTNLSRFTSEKLKKTFFSLFRLMHKEQELKTLEWDWDIHNPDRLINLEINNKRRTSII